MTTGREPHPYDLSKMPDPRHWRTESFAKMHKKLFQKYAVARVEGYSRFVSLRMVFGEDFVGPSSMQYCYAIEANAYFKWCYQRVIDHIELTKVWNPKVAVVALKQIVMDENNKEATRLAAIKELNVLSEITFVDDKGNTRAVRGIDSFYADANGEAPKTENPDDGAAKPETPVDPFKGE